MSRKKKTTDMENEINIKEASVELDITEPTLKKYVRDFKLGEISGSGSKSSILSNVFDSLKEIVKLRSNGLSVQEIKELMSEKTEEPDEEVELVLEEAVEISSPAIDKVNEEPDEDDSEEDYSEEEDDDDTDEESDNETDEELAEISLESDTAEIEVDSDEEDVEPEIEVETGEKRRKLFNRKYVERQISVDSKKVQSFRHRLSNPNLSQRDKLFFEEALDRRIHMLDGWRHILKWVALGNQEYYRSKIQNSESSENPNSETSEPSDEAPVSEASIES